MIILSALLYIIALLLLLLLVYLILKIIPAIRSYGVPFVKSKNNIIDEFIRDLQMEEGDVFLDLGCGDGEIISAVIEKFPTNKAIGYELQKHPYLLAKNRFSPYKNVSIERKNFFKTNRADVKIIYCYLMPHLMTSVYKKFLKECASGAILYSNSFQVKQTKESSKLFLGKSGKFENVIYTYRK